MKMSAAPITQPSPQNVNDMGSATAYEQEPMVEVHGESPMSLMHASSSPPSSTSKAKPIGGWTCEATMALLESAEYHGLWQYKKGPKTVKLCNITINLNKHYGEQCSVYTIDRMYKALLDQALEVSSQDKMKMGKAKPRDEVFILALKLADMQHKDKEAYEVSFLFLVYLHYQKGIEVTYENKCNVADKFTCKMCGPGFNYDGADLVSPKDGDDTEEDCIE